MKPETISETDNEHLKKIKRQRDLNLDLIRCAAIFCLPSIHFFRNSGFYDIPVTGRIMYLMTALRTMSMMCIPLFLLLTGYLMSKKRFSLKYFNGIVRVLIIFFLCNIPIYLYRTFTGGGTLSLKIFILQLFSGGEYSWYVGLYTWLFCLIPALNLLYNAVNSKSGKQALVLMVVGLTVLPTLGNYYAPNMPDLFTPLYPITYYLIGAYIRDYHKDGGKWSMLAFFAAAVIVSSGINIIVSRNQNFVYNIFNDWGSFENTLMATFLFLFLKKLNLSSVPKILRTIITKVAEWSFGAYLLSWIFDQMFYPKLAAAVPEILDRMKYYPVMVLAVLICSTLLSGIIHGIYNVITVISGKSRARLKRGASDNNISV